MGSTADLGGSSVLRRLFESRDVLARHRNAWPMRPSTPAAAPVRRTPIGLFRLITDDVRQRVLCKLAGKFVSLLARSLSEFRKPCAVKSELIGRSSISNAIFVNGRFGFCPGILSSERQTTEAQTEREGGHRGESPARPR